MGNIPVYKSTAPVTSEVGMVSQAALAGEIRENRGMAAKVGMVVSQQANDFLRALQENEIALQVATGKANATDAINQADLELQDQIRPKIDEKGNIVQEPDFNNAYGDYNKKITAIQQGIMGQKDLHPRSKEHLKIILGDMQVGADVKAKGFLKKSMLDYQKSKATTLTDQFVQQGDFNGAISLTNAEEAAGVYTPEEAEKVRRTVTEQIKENTIRNQLGALEKQYGSKGVLDYLSTPEAKKLGLTDKSLNDIQGDYRTKFSIEKYNQEQYEKQNEQAWDNRLANFYVNFDSSKPQDAIAMVKQLAKSGIKNLDTKMKTLMEFCNDPSKFDKTTNLPLYNELYNQALFHRIPTTEVDKYLGRGISTDDGIKIKTIINKDRESHEDQIEKDARKYINNNIATGKDKMSLDGLFGANNQEEANSIYSAFRALDILIFNAHQNNQSVEEALAPPKLAEFITHYLPGRLDPLNIPPGQKTSATKEPPPEFKRRSQ